jgi:formate-dependent phosphoribosylglycinamide formyltransferase (GAR transformylase)
MKRVLLLATATGYQTRAFNSAAAALGVELVFGLDRCRGLADPWGDRSLVVRYFDDARSLEAILGAAREGPIDGVMALGDQPTVLAAQAAAALGVPFHPPEAARASRNKLEARERFTSAGLPVPSFFCVDAAADPLDVVRRVSYPCVVKPLALSGSRGVMRADDRDGFVRAFVRLRHILDAPDVRRMNDPAHSRILVEGFIPGAEYAVEGLLHHGELQVLAVFDKPDPLDGPFFEETIYVTPSRASAIGQQRITAAIATAAAALGLTHGPVHAECRVNGDGVYVLEVAARPIGGLCARALRFVHARGCAQGSRGAMEPPRVDQDPDIVSLDALLLRHAIGEDVRGLTRETRASGVMMIPIPRAGVYRGADGVDAARAVDGIRDVLITAKPDQHLVPLPEGASYLGFLFASAATSPGVVASLHLAHDALQFRIDRELQVAGPGG